jgi:hypothetical protein
MGFLIQNTIFKIIAHNLYLVFATLYILAEQVNIDAFRAFKGLPLLMLISLVLPQTLDKSAIKSIAGVICGIIGDYIL